MNRNDAAVMQALIESTNAQVWSVDRNYCVLYCNAIFKNMVRTELGHELQLGEYILDSIYGAEVVKTWKEHYDRIFKGERFEMETIYITPDKQEYITHYVLNPIYDNTEIIGASVFGTDISEKRQVEKLIKTSEANLKALIENTDQPIWSINKELQLITLNSAFKEAQKREFSIDIQEGMSLVNVFPKAYQEQWTNLYIRALNGERFSIQHEHPTSQGISYFETSFNPIFDDHESVIGAAMFGKDITLIKQTEKELTNAKELAEDAVRTKSEFLATVSHEIKTPMNAVIGLTNLLMQSEFRPDQLDQLKTLRFSAENLLSLLNNVLDFSKIESNKLAFEEAEFTIEDILTNIKNSLIVKTNEKNVIFNIQTNGEIPKKLIGDPIRLTQILYNITSNAVKFTNEGQISLSVCLESINEQDVVLLFSVKDTGIGIHQDEQNRIFDIFTHANAEISNQFGGTGLGLTIARMLIEKQNSELHVLSTPGKGSEFFFSLKFKIPEYTTVRKTQQNNSYTELKGIKALIVDDNQINCMVAKKFLDGWNVDTTVAYDGFQALEKTKKIVYDFILMDIRMPGIDGYEATKMIRNQKENKNKHTPIIALTAAALEGIHEKAEESGMNDYMLKPFNPKELYAKILKNINGHSTIH